MRCSCLDIVRRGGAIIVAPVLVIVFGLTIVACGDSDNGDEGGAHNLGDVPDQPSGQGRAA